MTDKPMLTDLLDEGQVVMGGAYDCISAAVCESAGFPVLMLGGAGLSASFLGLPDLGLLSIGDLIPIVGNIVSSVKIPVVVDIDTGYGNELNVTRTCERLAMTGVAAVHLEDQTFPKRCGHMAGKTVIDRTAYLSKVRVAVRALEGTGTQLIARTDSYGTHGLEEAIARCNGALELGADITFAEAPTTRQDIEKLGRTVPGHKMFNLATGGNSPSLTMAELAELDFTLVSVPGVTFMPAIAAMKETAAAVLREGSDAPVAKFNMGPKDLFETVGLQRWLAIEEDVTEWVAQH